MLNGQSERIVRASSGAEAGFIGYMPSSHISVFRDKILTGKILTANIEKIRDRLSSHKINQHTFTLMSYLDYLEKVKIELSGALEPLNAGISRKMSKRDSLVSSLDKAESKLETLTGELEDAAQETNQMHAITSPELLKEAGLIEKKIALFTLTSNASANSINGKAGSIIDMRGLSSFMGENLLILATFSSHLPEQIFHDSLRESGISNESIGPKDLLDPDFLKKARKALCSIAEDQKTVETLIKQHSKEVTANRQKLKKYEKHSGTKASEENGELSAVSSAIGVGAQTTSLLRKLSVLQTNYYAAIDEFLTAGSGLPSAIEARNATQNEVDALPDLSEDLEEQSFLKGKLADLESRKKRAQAALDKAESALRMRKRIFTDHLSHSPKAKPSETGQIPDVRLNVSFEKPFRKRFIPSQQEEAQLDACKAERLQRFIAAAKEAFAAPLKNYGNSRMRFEKAFCRLANCYIQNNFQLTKDAMLKAFGTTARYLQYASHKSSCELVSIAVDGRQKNYGLIIDIGEIEKGEKVISLKSNPLIIYVGKLGEGTEGDRFLRDETYYNVRERAKSDKRFTLFELLKPNEKSQKGQ